MNSKDILKLTVQKIKEARIEAGFSIEELSKITGLSVYKIKKIESGKYNFQLKEFNKIAEFLNLKLTLKKVQK